MSRFADVLAVTLPAARRALAILLTLSANAAAAPQLLVTPDPIDFGLVAVGMISAPMAVTVTNTSASHIMIYDFGVGRGANLLEFNTVESAQIEAALLGNGIIVSPGSSLTFHLVFAPAAPGMRSAELDFGSSDPGQRSGHINLVGNGGPSPLSVAPEVIDFGTSLIGTKSAPKSVVVRNAGMTDLTITRAVLAGLEWMSFHLDETVQSRVLPAGQTMPLHITFTPIASGEVTITLKVTVRDFSDPLTVDVAGNGCEAALALGLAHGESSLDFGTQEVGTTSDSRSVSIIKPLRRRGRQRHR